MRRFSLAFLVVLALAGSLIGPGTAGAEEALVAACPGPGGLSSGFGPSDDYGRLAQTFVPSLSDSLTRAEFDLVEPQGETRPYVVQILAVDGTGTPTDTVLAQTTAPDLPPGFRTLSATFAFPAFVIAGQTYALGLTRPVGGEWYWRLP